MSSGKFIVIEGLEGAGKSSAIALVQKFLKEQGVQQLVNTREPGGTPMAEQLRTLVKQPSEDEVISDETECLLIYAARKQLMANVIEPALKRGDWVLGDRHDLSSRAYQGGGRGLTELVDSVSNIVLGDFKPDFTLYLDIDPKIGLARAAARGELDRIEQQALEFFERTRARYQQIANSSPNIVTIDASQPIEQVHQDIEQALQRQFCIWNR